MIEICNFKIINSLRNKYDFSVARGTPLGNPYFMQDESKRNKVCDKYDEWFYNAAHNQDFFNYLEKIKNTYVDQGKIRLFCWCAPKRCHAETIKKYIEADLSFFS